MTRNSNYHTVRILGGLLPSDLLERVGAQDPDLESSSPVDYDLAPGERLGEAITRSWNRLQPLWERFSERTDQAGALTGPTRQEWLLPLFQELGFGHLSAGPGFEIEGKAYPISHLWESTPVHLVGVGVDLDRRMPGVAGAATASPHGLMQEFLNRSDDHLWAMVSNGYQLRLLRDNASLTRTAYVEFDLREMFEGDAYSDFALLWLTCHASRLEGPAGTEVLERWREDAATRGIRALDALRNGVESAIETLGSAAVGHADNIALRQQLDDGTLDAQDLYRQILRVVYRFLFLFVAEGRNLLLDPATDQAARSRYQRYYSITRLRDLAGTTRGGMHGDLWQQHSIVAQALEATGEPALGLLPLGGFLWSREATDALNDVTVPNEALLSAVRSLTVVSPPGELPQRVDYANLGAEELGSIYESLLEYMPEVNPVIGTFTLKVTAGNEKKTTGSYYTPTSLINELLDSALDPVIDEAARSDNPEQAILNLKVVDPAAGSGHFLIAAANRIADRLARTRSGDNEPSPDQLRTALRDVIGRCVYAVDINPMAVELAKVALWIEAMEPGKPLTFLDHHIVSGNSLLGTTPHLLENGIPDAAFKTLTGDDKDLVKTLRVRNRTERKKGLASLTFGDSPEELLDNAARELTSIDRLGDQTVDAVVEKRRRYRELVDSTGQRHLRLAADSWVASFFNPKRNDLPTITTAIVNAALHDPGSLPATFADQISETAAQFSFHHWNLTFPDVFAAGPGENANTGWSGGFDVVLGNPPWDQIQYDPQEAFAASHPEIAHAGTMAKRNTLIAELEEADPSRYARHMAELKATERLQHFVHTSGNYPLTSFGRLNTAPLFVESARSILNSHGRVGLVLPTTIATSSFNQAFFQDILEQEQLISLYDFFNRGFFPGAAGSQGNRFCLLTLSRQPTSNPEFLFLAESVLELSDLERRFHLTLDEIRKVNPNTQTAPAFKTRRDLAITMAIYRKWPVLILEGDSPSNPWEIDLQLMFMMNAASHLFKTREDLTAQEAVRNGNTWDLGDLKWMPLYEGKMTHQFNHRWGTYSGVALTGKGIRQLPTPEDEQLEDPTYVVQPRYWIDANEVSKSLPNPQVSWLLGFRDVTSPIDYRTMIPSILPAVAVGHSEPLIHVAAGAAHASGLLAVLGSFVLDYVARQKVGGTHMTFYIFKQLAVPTPMTLEAPTSWNPNEPLLSWLSVRVLELVYVAWDVSGFARDLGFTLPPLRWSTVRRSELRAELDAALFHLFGIERDDVDYIMETFTIVKRRDMAGHGSYRTKELILDVYDRMAEAIESGEPYQTLLDPPPADPSLCHSQERSQ